MNFVILFLCKKIFREQKTFIILGSFFISGLSAIFLLFEIGGILNLLFKLAVWAGAVCISFRFKTLKKFCLLFFSYLFLNAVMSGVCVLIASSNGKVEMGNGFINYSSVLPIGIIILLILISSILIYQLLNVAKNKIKLSSFIYKVKIKNNSKEINLKGFLDSGNTLIDPNTNKPVFIISYFNFKKLFKISLDKLIIGKFNEELNNHHYIEVGSVGTKMKMLVFSVEELIVKDGSNHKKFKDAILGLSYQNFDNKLGSGIILSSYTF